MTDESPEERQKAAAFYAKHGYPYGEAVNLAWLQERLAVASRQLMKLSVIEKVPTRILRNQRKIIGRCEEWIVAWLKEHPYESIEETE